MKKLNHRYTKHCTLPNSLLISLLKPKIPTTPVSFFAPTAAKAVVNQTSLEIPAAELPIDSGARLVPDRTAFDHLARRDDVPGALGVMEVKFLLTEVDTDNPIIYFLNTNNIQYHFIFATTVLGLQLTNTQFNQQTYFTNNRKFLAGTILAHDKFTWPSSEQGIYVLEFWPTDPVKSNYVNMAYRAIKTAMPFTKNYFSYHPVGETHQELYEDEKELFEELGVEHISTDQLFGSTSYSPLNLGEGFGRLRLIDSTDAQPPTIRDVVIFKQLPNDLTHVAGVLTELPQTPLSHINLKAKQNDTPNAYLKNASEDIRITPLLGKLVYLKVTPDNIEIREASQTEVDNYIENSRPSVSQLPKRDITRTQIVNLNEIGSSDLQAYGAKAANVAELSKILTADNMVPNGYAVPFYFYHRFMTENRLYEKCQKMIVKTKFQQNPEVREKKLKKFRKQIMKAPLADDLAQALSEMHSSFPIGRALRCRSSTNNEDLEGFNGAGLYDSYTHRQNEGHIGKSIKQVWASLWNYRAFEERDFYRIDHFVTSIAVLVHPNYDDEIANGVGLTKNIFDPNWEGYYINSQVGEALVTNPEPGASPDELLVMRTVISDNPTKLGNETIYIRRSSLVTPPNHVLTDQQIELLTNQMRAIQTHFSAVYGRQNDQTFAMDIEFKIDKKNQLIIKQARPWVD
jgi:pyruvate, water dikinase